MDENNTQQPGGFPDTTGYVNPQQPDTVSPSTSSKPSARYTFTLLICILLALRIMKPVDFRPANMYIHLLKFHFPSIIKYIIIYKELLTGYGFTNLYLTNVTIPSHNYM